MNKRMALYYPTIEFNNPKWLWTAALLWDRIYRIVPNGYTPKDSRNILELMEDGTIGGSIDPSMYSSEVADKFIDKYNGTDWNAPALGNYELMSSKYINLHRDKADVKVRNLFTDLGKKNNEWIEVPEYIAGLYMLYLANHISNTNGLALITDSSASWCGTNYFSYDGKIDDFEIYNNTTDKLASLVIQDFIPKNILDISPKELLKFRERRKDERNRFLNCMDSLASDISNCKDPKIVNDIIESHKKDILDSKKEFKKSLDMIRVSGWFGVKSALVPVAMPVMTSMNNLSDSTKLWLNASGILFGVIAGFLDAKQKTSKLSKEYKYNYLLELKSELERAKVCVTGYEDYNSFLEYEMNNFIHD
ncbi:hypothetical protein CCS79_09150 [Clostridium diolis]|uniref:hypothetical protein n=1 Tax=Clostridium diolis TaxID=223919 RepID=UPI000B3FA814|nr:hypothetical protein [Clostridium diolis]OVE69081.1 hypothetical protein CCS79_09150 [Clostridium diolis]